jgi:hypothetical protein
MLSAPPHHAAYARALVAACAVSLASSVALSAAVASRAVSEESVSDPVTVRERLAARQYPSIFQAWNAADNVPDEDPWTTVARHDLVWGSPWFFGLAWASYTPGLVTGFTEESVAAAQDLRGRLLASNPNVVLIAEIRYRDAHRSFLPEDHRWWLRDEDGSTIAGWEEGGYDLLAFNDAEYRAHVATRAQAAVATGVIDGVLLDWWSDDPDRLELVSAVRQAIGPNALIIVNSNDREVPASAPYVNGLFMEAYRSETPDDWRRIENTLTWAEESLREPRVNCLETWFHDSRADLSLMRATTTLALTLSDGYCLFSDPNPLPTSDHLHDWYAFWDKGLGQPSGAAVEGPDGAYRREFTGGTVVYNPSGGAPLTTVFRSDRISRATGLLGRAHIVAPGDGDIFLTP